MNTPTGNYLVVCKMSYEASFCSLNEPNEVFQVRRMFPCEHSSPVPGMKNYTLDFHG